MTPDLFTFKWFMTLFSAFLPFNYIAPIYDAFLVEGWRAIFRIGVAWLKMMEDELMNMNMENMCLFLRDTVRCERISSEFKLYSLAARVRVNKILIHNREL